MCGSMCTLFWMHKEVRSAGSLGAGVQAILSGLIWVLGFELRSSERSVQAALNLWAIYSYTHSKIFKCRIHRETLSRKQSKQKISNATKSTNILCSLMPKILDFLKNNVEENEL